MKSGARALGVAESYRGERSTIAGAVVRRDRVVDGFAFERCTVGGTDATDAVRSLFGKLDRQDLQYVLLAGIAPAWFNILDLEAIEAHTDLPVISVSFESSPGLVTALEDAFDGSRLQDRLERYRKLPNRHEIDLNGETVFLRTLGIDVDQAAVVVRAFTPEGGRPEPLRVARLAARGADQLGSE